MRQLKKSNTRRHHSPCQISQTAQVAQVAPQRCPILSVSKSNLSVAPILKLCQCQIYATQVSTVSVEGVQR